MTKVAIITGVSGQDGSFLAELLLSKEYHVFGLIRRSSHLQDNERLESIINNPNLHLVFGDITDLSSVINLISQALKLQNYNPPLEIYNLAAQSHVMVSFEMPVYTANVNAIGFLNVLEAVRQLGISTSSRIYQASTSELYGSTPPPQSEDTTMVPQSPYAISKMFSYMMVRNYRDSYNMYIVNGILFNHESERRPSNFVTRKVTKFAAAYKKGKINTHLEIGNLYAKRDWGYARDYVEAMWLMLQQATPRDYVISSSEQHTVKEFIEAVFKFIEVDLKWFGSGIDEYAVDTSTGSKVVVVNKTLFRPAEVDSLCGDSTKAQKELGWKNQTSFTDLVKIMVTYDLAKCI